MSVSRISAVSRPTPSVFGKHRPVQRRHCQTAFEVAQIAFSDRAEENIFSKMNGSRSPIRPCLANTIEPL